MKTLIILLCIFTSASLFAQTLPDTSQTGKLYLNATFNPSINGQTNLGFGGKIGLGYNISKSFTLILSLGYSSNHVNSYTNIYYGGGYTTGYDPNIITTTSHDKENFKFMPFDLTLRYNFNVLGMQSYAFFQGGWNYLIEDNYAETITTKLISTNQVINSRKINYSAKDFGGSRFFSQRGIGLGTLLPLSNSIKLDLSYTLLSNEYKNDLTQNFGIGLNFGF